MKDSANIYTSKPAKMKPMVNISLGGFYPYYLVSFKIEPRDLYVGVFWDIHSFTQNNYKNVHLFFVPFPSLVFHTKIKVIGNSLLTHVVCGISFAVHWAVLIWWLSRILLMF